MKAVIISSLFVLAIAACNTTKEKPTTNETPAPPPATEPSTATPTPAPPPAEPAPSTGSGGSQHNTPGSMPDMHHDMGSTGAGMSNDPRARRDQIVDELYGQFGGGNFARGLQTNIDKTKPGFSKDVKQDVGGVVNKVDRTAFAAQCSAVGKGEEPVWGGSDRAKEFFQQSEVREKCAEVAHLNKVIDDRDESGADIHP